MGEGKRHIFILSGGGSPSSNHYSQYLQALRLNDFFRNQPNTEVDLFFGSGLTPQSPSSSPPDVVRQETPDAPSTLIKGTLEGNQPATYEAVQNYFKKIVATKPWQPTDQFLLVIADHGGPNDFDPTDIEMDGEDVKQSYDNNCISLWSPGITAYPEQKCLSVEELKDWLQQSVPTTVPTRFVMSQCYSGGFHFLGYTLDEKGFPKKSGNVCGFTAITEDTTAAGCTSFVDSFRYDGYERRIAEAITGVSILTGQRIKEPAGQLKDAHEEAFLKDNTKDIPLRTSEAFVLDYLKAQAKQEEKGEEKSKDKKLLSRFELELRQFFFESNLERIFDKLPIPLRKDYHQRLEQIQIFRTKLEQWHSTHRYEIVDKGFENIWDQRVGVDKMMDRVEKEKEKLGRSIKKKMRPIVVDYLHALKKGDHPTAKEYLEFEKLEDMNSSVVYTRLSGEDPTLEKYKRYINYSNDRTKIILDWAEKQENKDGIEELEEVRSLRRQRNLIGREIDRLELLQGQLQRLEIQMRVAAGVAWLAIKGKTDVLEEISSLVACENNSSLK